MIEPQDLGIIADDLTGACDVAACFASRPGAVGVRISPGCDLPAGPGLQVLNTQSRLMDQDSARDMLHRVGTLLGTKKIIFKKIDAGLRGPVGAELQGLLDGVRSSGEEWTSVVAPAIPAIGRITRNGKQFERGIPIDRGAVSDDPGSAPRCADIRELVKRTGGGDCTVADAETAEDLDGIVASYLSKGRVVFTGSLGLATALAGQVSPANGAVEGAPPARRPVLVSGSRHPLSYQQMEQVWSAGRRLLTFEPAHLQFVEQASGSGESSMMVRIQPNEAGVTTASPANILRSFVDALCLLLERIKPDGLGVIGGETAFHILRRLGATRLEVFERKAEVIAFSRISGGAMDGCRFVSKGGTVGPSDAACQMLSLLTT